MPVDYVLCAAPSYLARFGVPSTPADLSTHDCLVSTSANGAGWQFTGPDGPTEVPISGRLQVNNVMLRCDAARAGAGLLLCPDYLVEDDFTRGRLIRLLPGHKPAGSTLHAVSPAYRAGSPKVRSLVNHLASQLGDPE